MPPQDTSVTPTPAPQPRSESAFRRLWTKLKASKLASYGLSAVVVLLVAIVGVHLLTASHADVPVPNCTLSNKLVPSCGKLWGYYPSGGKLSGYQYMSNRTNRQFNLVKFYEGLGSEFPTKDQISLAKTSPTVTVLHFAIQTKNIAGNASGVQPAGHATCTNKGQTFSATGWTYQQINDGSMDAWLKHLATNINKLNQPVMIDFQHEVDGSSTFGACSGTAVAVGTGYAYAGSSNADFVAAYHHVHDVMSAIAPKIVWAQIYAGWGSGLDRYKSTYAGDNYVDWVGWDPYNHPSSPSGSRTPAQTFTGAAFYKYLTSKDPANQISAGIASKPRMLGEYGGNSNSSVDGKTANREAWMEAIPAGIKAAGLTGVEYFDTQGWSKFTGDPNAENGFKAAGFDSSVNANFTYGTAPTSNPTISGVAPATGSTSGGTSVTITGTNLPSGLPSATFGDTLTTAVSRSGNTVTVMAPAHSPGSVSVTLGFGSTLVTKTNAFTYIAPPPKPRTADLVIIGGYAAPVSPRAGDKVKFSATVKNQGTLDIPNNDIFGVSFSVDGQKVDWSSGLTTGLASGATTTMTADHDPFHSFGAWTATAGVHTVVASVNNQGNVAESDTTNNTFSFTITVLPAVPKTPLIPPSGFKAVKTTSNSVKLSWQASTGGKNLVYTVWRNGGAIASQAATGYTDKSVTAGTKYTYKVVVYDEAGRSAVSKTVTTQTKISGCSTWDFWHWRFGSHGLAACQK